MREYQIYTIDSWDKYIETGIADVLVNANPSDDAYILAWEGGEQLVKKA